MRTETGYRYSLNFRSDSAEKVRVGEFLESIGHKKSAVMIKALLEYLDRNPKLETTDENISITLEQTFSRKDIEVIIRDFLQENGSLIAAVPPAGDITSSQQDEPYDDVYVNSMIDKLSEHFDF